MLTEPQKKIIGDILTKNAFEPNDTITFKRLGEQIYKSLKESIPTLEEVKVINGTVLLRKGWTENVTVLNYVLEYTGAKFSEITS